MSSVPTLEQYLWIGTNFDPPQFSLDNAFKFGGRLQGGIVHKNMLPNILQLGFYVGDY
jgi:hypothetical protein